MKKSLFKDFPEVSTKEWKQKIQFDLKGLDYNDALIWQSPEGINVKPFYNSDDLSQTKPLTNSNDWRITESIYVADVKKSNENAKDKLNRGTESLCFILPDNKIEIEDLLSGLEIKNSSIQIKCEFLDKDFIQKVKGDISKNIKYENPLKDIFIHTDIIGNLAETGNWYKNLEWDHNQFEAIVNNTRTLTINSCLYQNAGANMVQELAYALAHCNEYFNHLEGKIKLGSQLNIIYKVSVGSNYFFEIAKLRAARILMSLLAEEYKFSIHLSIYASPTKRNKTIYDFNTNMLRSTTECMSAILGGADYVENIAYDSVYHKSNEFGDRIARNQLLILREESHFDAAANAAEGTYYIESLTSQLTDKALALFKDIEHNGGLLKLLKSGKIQQKIKESAGKEQKMFDEGEIKLVGTNHHIHKNDRMKEELELFPFLKRNPRKTLIEPIIERRLASGIEEKRIEGEA